MIYLLKQLLLLHRSCGLVKFFLALNHLISLKPYRSRLVFFKRSLSEDIPVYDCPIKDITIIRIDKNSDDTLLSNRIFEQIERENDSNFTKATIVNKLNRGGALFVGLRGKDTIVHHTWVETGEVTIPDIYLRCKINNDTAYFASTFTPVEYRKFGIGKFVRAHVLAFCRENKFKNAVLNIGANNLASISLAESMGFKEYQKVNFFRLLGLKFYAIRASQNGKKVYKFGVSRRVWDYFYDNVTSGVSTKKTGSMK